MRYAVQMNTLLLTAAGISFLLGLAHSWLGEQYILIRLFRRDDLPRLFGSDLFTKRTLRFAWHLTTIAWWGAAAIFIVLARQPHGDPAQDIARVLAATFLVSSVLSFTISRGRHLSWIFLLAIALAAWNGT